MINTTFGKLEGGIFKYFTCFYIKLDGGMKSAATDTPKNAVNLNTGVSVWIKDEATVHKLTGEIVAMKPS